MRPFERRAARPPVSRPVAACLVLALLAGPRGAVAATDPRDRTFAGTGSLLVDLGGDDTATAVAVDAGGRILVAGTTRGGEREERVLIVIGPGGTLGASPRAQGAPRDVPPAARVGALAPGPDGTLLLGGATTEESERAFVVRLLPDGRRDPSFAAELPDALAAARPGSAVLALGLDAQGRIVVAGRSGADPFVARLAANGALDRSFARDGTATLAIPARRAARVVAAAVAPDGGAAFVVGPARSTDAPLVLRTRDDGALDEGFGRGGVADVVIGGGALAPRSVALDASGRVVIGATLAASDGEHAMLLRLAPDGARDETFGVRGAVDATAAAHADVGAAVAAQPDGRVVAAGSQGSGAARDLAVVRFTSGDARCGDGTVTSGEQCDDGSANGGAGSCCSAACTLRAAGTACRPADGACDEAELCDGRSARCPEDAVARAGAPCRAAVGACDVAEVCTGASRACPANDVRARGTVCRVASGACDLDEECDGVAGECPTDAKRTGECRASRGGCDPAEWCDGASGDCPADVLLPDGAACDDGDACTADDVCVENVCRGGPRDELACAGWLCSRIRSKRRVTGAPPRAADMRALGLDVQVDGARAVCRPAVAPDDATPGTSTPREDDAAARAADAADDRGAYVAYKVTPDGRRRARDAAPRLVSATLEDRFGTLELAPRQVRLVSLPAWVGAAEAGGAPGGATYQCQQIALADVVATRAREVAVRVVGEAASERFAVGRPLRVCHPADPDADATDQGDARVCYELRRLGVETAAASGPLLAVDAFQSLLVEKIGEPQLCVSALLVRAEWDDPVPRRRPRLDPDARRPHRPRNPEHEPRPHRGARSPRAADDTAAP